MPPRIGKRWAATGWMPTAARAWRISSWRAESQRVTERDADDLEEQHLLELTRAEIKLALEQGEFKVLAWMAIMSLALNRLSPFNVGLLSLPLSSPCPLPPRSGEEGEVTFCSFWVRQHAGGPKNCIKQTPLPDFGEGLGVGTMLPLSRLWRGLLRSVMGKMTPNSAIGVILFPLLLPIDLLEFVLVDLVHLDAGVHQVAVGLVAQVADDGLEGVRADGIGDRLRS